MASSSQVHHCPFRHVCVSGRFHPVHEALPQLQLVAAHRLPQDEPDATSPAPKGQHPGEQVVCNNKHALLLTKSCPPLPKVKRSLLQFGGIQGSFFPLDFSIRITHLNAKICRLFVVRVDADPNYEADAGHIHSSVGVYLQLPVHGCCLCSI